MRQLVMLSAGLLGVLLAGTTSAAANSVQPPERSLMAGAAVQVEKVGVWRRHYRRSWRRAYRAPYVYPPAYSYYYPPPQPPYAPSYGTYPYAGDDYGNGYYEDGYPPENGAYEDYPPSEY